MKSLVGYGCKHYGQGAAYTAVLSHKVSKVLAGASTEMKNVPAVSAGVIRLTELPHRFQIGYSARGHRAASPSALPTPVTADDVFHIGSCTKSFMGLLLNELQHEKPSPQLSDLWNLTLGEVFPNLPAEWKTTTIESLMSHRAGIDDELFLYQLDTRTKRTFFVLQQIFGGAYPVVRKLWEEFRIEEGRLGELAFEERIQTTRRKRLVDLVFKCKPIPQLVGHFCYSNSGVAIVSLVLEELTKRPFEYLMRDYVFGPLGMHSAGFGTPDTEFLHKVPPKDAKVTPNQPWGHYKGLFQRRTTCVPPWTKDDGTPDFFSAAGNIHLNMQDWLKFLGATIAIARTTQQHPQWFPRGGPVSPGDPQTGYGRGWIIMDTTIPPAPKSPLGVRLTERLVGKSSFGVALPGFGEVTSADKVKLSHSGSTGLWYATCTVDLAAGVAVAVLTNAANISAFHLMNQVSVKMLEELKED
eukprot:TRINITY_DN22132_c0_g1_i1.p1 TRINITY_DN22132_c0_g1~~TRINITY_DN22132_c0_g1_i1.p1  ORF type:complete len:468 (+),score=69.55 TRINITY_DN22132_c0_g1_i1:19-1422(+)